MVKDRNYQFSDSEKNAHEWFLLVDYSFHFISLCVIFLVLDMAL